MKKPIATDNLSKAYIANLDGLRCVAILLVVMGHLRYNQFPMADNSRIHLFMASFGSMGVDIFFAISGYLITIRLLKEFSSSKTIGFGNFYIRRFFRLIPALAVYLVFISFIALFEPRIALYKFEVLASALFFRNYYTGPSGWFTAHFWSLAVEEHFYLFYPVLLLFLAQSTEHRAQRKRALFMSLVGISVLFLLWQAIDTSEIHSLAHLALDPHTRSDYRMPSLLFGAAVGARHSLSHERPCPRAPLYLTMASLTFLTFLIAKAPLPEVWRPIILAEIVGLVILGGKNWVVYWLEWPVIAWIGRISYSVYLWQQLFLIPFDLKSDLWFAALPFNLFFPFLFATMSYYFIEKPLIKLGHTLSGHTTAKS